MRNPAAFLFDEPLSNLDAKLRQQMRVELKRLHTELNATMIYVTHDQVEAMTLGDRVAVMNQGKIMQVGKPMEVYHRPANLFVARFIGAVPINLWRATVQRQGTTLSVKGENSLGLQYPLPDSRIADRIVPDGRSREIVIGVRSEDLRAATGPGNTHLRGTVVAIDRLGDSAMVHLDPVGGDANQPEQRKESVESAETGGALVFRAESDFSAAEGAEIPIAIDPDRINWFDRQTGENLLKEKR